MWNSDLKGRSEKLEREQNSRLERQRLKAEKEKAEKDRFAQKVRQHEEEASRRRAAFLAAQDIVSHLYIRALPLSGSTLPRSPSIDLPLGSIVQFDSFKAHNVQKK